MQKQESDHVLAAFQQTGGGIVLQTFNCAFHSIMVLEVCQGMHYMLCEKMGTPEPLTVAVAG
jgi:hypothetical protein